LAFDFDFEDDHDGTGIKRSHQGIFPVGVALTAIRVGSRKTMALATKEIEGLKSEI
jgi:hypothetical protein